MFFIEDIKAVLQIRRRYDLTRTSNIDDDAVLGPMICRSWPTFIKRFIFFAEFSISTYYPQPRKNWPNVKTSFLKQFGGLTGLAD